MLMKIAHLIGVDKLIFQDLTALTESVQLENPAIQVLIVQYSQVNILQVTSRQNIWIKSQVNGTTVQRKNEKNKHLILKFIMNNKFR